MRVLPPRRRAKPAAGTALLLVLAAAGLGGPTPAIGAPQYATPDPGSPAGTEYGFPMQQGRGQGGGGGGHDSFGGGGGGGGSGGGGGGGGGAAGSHRLLFGIGIAPTGHRGSGLSSSSGSFPRSGSGSGGSGSSGSGSYVGSAPGDGTGNAVRDAGLSARAVAEKVAADSGGFDGQVALVVLIVLGSGALLAGAIRLTSRRSPGAA